MQSIRNYINGFLSRMDDAWDKFCTFYCRAEYELDLVFQDIKKDCRTLKNTIIGFFVDHTDHNRILKSMMMQSVMRSYIGKRYAKRLKHHQVQP